MNVITKLTQQYQRAEEELVRREHEKFHLFWIIRYIFRFLAAGMTRKMTSRWFFSRS